MRYFIVSNWSSSCRIDLRINFSPDPDYINLSDHKTQTETYSNKSLAIAHLVHSTHIKKNVLTFYCVFYKPKQLNVIIFLKKKSTPAPHMYKSANESLAVALWVPYRQ